ncbi:MAG: DNA topoisomerase [Lachnospiraceae bacterium]
MAIHNKEELDEILASWRKAVCGGGCEIRRARKKPPIPFTTSTLQQEASKVLNFSTQKTMRIAQQLYEGVDVKGMEPLV